MAVLSQAAIAILLPGRAAPLPPSAVRAPLNRRYRAARLAGIERAPCVIRIADRDTAFVLNLIENAQRRELSQGDRLRAISLLAAMHDAQGRSPLTYSQIRERTRLSMGTISSLVSNRTTARLARG